MLLLPFGDIGLSAHVSGHITGGTDGHIHRLAIGRECDVARPVAAAGGQIGNHGFRRSRGLHVASLVGETDNFSLQPHVDPFRIGPRRIEGDPIGVLEAVGEGRGGLGLVARFGGADDGDLAVRAALGEENIAIRGEADHARALQARGEGLDLEAGHGLQLGVRRLRHNLGAIGGGGRGERSGHILRPDLAHQAGGVAVPIAIGGGPATIIER